MDPTADTDAFKREFMSSIQAEFVTMMKSEVRAVLENEMASIKTDVHAIRAGFDEFKATISTEVAAIRSTLGDAERSLTACTDDVETLKHEVKRLGALTDSLQDKCEDLELRSRRCNLRIVGVPEGPNSCSPDSVSSLLQKAFDLDEAPLVDRSHRSLQPTPRPGQHPRTIVARLHYYRDCVNILRLAREKQRIKLKDMSISVFPDFTARVAKARAAFNSARQQLRGLQGVRFGILHPAKLRITFNGKEKTFVDPKEAETYIAKSITPFATHSG